jgi:ribosome silencing factor RsfS/YbeB/iojap
MLSKITECEIKRKLKEMLGDERYKHSLSVQRMARELARIHGADEEKASLAGLVHDCAKWMSPFQSFRAAKRYGIQLNAIERNLTGTLHALIGGELAADLFGINDPEILSAIKSHTTGRAQMSLMDKILYVADYAEPLREYEGAAQVRKLAYKDIDLAMLEAIEQKVQHLLEKKTCIHPNTLAARNEILRIPGMSNDECQRVSRKFERRNNLDISAQQIAQLAAEAALSRKANNVVILDLRGIASFTDFFVICGGNSDTHLQGISDAILEKLEEYAVELWHKEGGRNDSWILLDYVDVVVHLFLREAREFYNLERLWADAHKVEFPEAIVEYDEEYEDLGEFDEFDE